MNGSDITDTSGSPVVIDDSAAVTGTLTVDLAVFAEGGVATLGANINTGGGTINLVGGNIVNVGSVGSGTLAVTSNATIGQDLSVGRNLTVAGNITTTTGDIVTVSGDVVAGGIRLDSSTGRVTGVAAGVANTDAVNLGQLNAAVTGSLAAVNARIDTLGGRVSILEDDARKAFQGVAMGFAMNAAPLNLANGEGGISGGAGIFEGEYAGAIRAQFVTETGFGVGANVGFSEDSVGGGVGASIKF